MIKKTKNKKTSSPKLILKPETNSINDATIVQVLESLPIGAIIYTLSNILFINSFAVKILKPNKKLHKTINKHSIFEFLLPEYHKVVKDNAKKLFKGESVTPRVYKLKNDSNHLYSIEVKSNIINFKGEKAIQAVFTDVSERNKNEEKLIEQNRTLKLLSENYSDVIFTYHFFPQPHVKFISDSVFKLLGKKPIEIYKDPLIFMNQIHKDDMGNFVNILGDYIKVSNNTKVNKATFRFFHKNGKLIFVEVSVSPIYDDKKIIGIIGMMRNITKEKQEELLRIETEEKFRLIAQNANDIIFFYSYYPKPKYLYLSPSIKKVLGYSEKDFYNDPNLCYSLVADLKEYRNFEKNITKQQKNNSFKGVTTVFQYKTKTGKLIWLEDNYSPIYDNDGKIKFILGISRDITKERTAQLELEQKWNNYRNLLDSSPIGIFIHEGYCIYSNKTAANILEVSNPKKLVGKYLIDYIVPEQQQRAKDRMGEAIKGKQFNDIIYKVITEKGNIIEVELITGPFIYNGKPCVQTIISNISAEKQLSKEILRAEMAEEANKNLTEEINYRQKIQQELVTQTVKYEAIFNNTTHLIWTVNKDLKITSFNQNYFNYVKTILNHELKTGEYIGDVGQKNKGDLKLNFWINKYNDFFNNKKDNNAEFFELKNTGSNGKEYYRELFLHPIRSNDGKVIEIAIIAFDSTERRQSEQKIIEQSAKLEAIFESGSQLIWTVDKNYFFTSFNTNFSDAMFDIYKIRPTLDKKIYKPHRTKQGHQYHNWWIEKYREVLENGISIEFTTEQLNVENKKIYRQIFIHPILKNGLVEEIACISNDITELRHLQNDSINQAAKLKSIFESSSHLIWTVDKNFKITSFNKNFSQTFKQNNGVDPELNKQLHTLIPKRKQADYKSYWYSIYKKVLDGNSLKLERQQLNSSGEVNYNEIYLNPTRNNNNEIIEIACLAHDITENKRFELQILDQSAKLKAIFESGDHLIWTVNKKFELTSYNQNYFNLIKDNLQRKKLVENSLISVFDTIKNKERKKFWINKYKLVLTGKPNVFIHKTTINNKDIYREIYLHPILLNNEVVEVSVIAQNITERIENQNIIIDQSAKLKAIFESGDHLIWTVNKKFEITSYNQNFFNIIKKNIPAKKLDENKLISVFDTMFDKELIELWIGNYKLALAGNPTVFIHKIQINNSDVYREIHLHPIHLNNEVVEVSVIAHNITERVENQNLILEQSAKLKAIFESGDQLMWTIGRDLKLTSFNKNYANSIFDLYGYYPELGKTMRTAKSNEVHIFWDEKYKLAFEGKQLEFISERNKQDGQKIIRQIVLYPIKDANGNVLEVSGIAFDITENKKNEEKITQSLKEKDVLLKEVHHRVKNNMQVISSILNLQSSYVKDTYALNLLKECQNRIKSMAFIHESLYQTKNFESVNFSEYVAILTKNLVHTYSVNTKKIKLILTLDKLFLNLDASIPCGLIINEIISNSLKYAFPDNIDGIIFITLRVDKNKVKIEVGDNGIGIPEDIDIKNTQTLGLQLVDTLIEQINGTLTLSRKNGTIFSIDFNI